MQVDLITPDKKAFSGEASSVLLPGTDGYFEILENHAPLVGAWPTPKPLLSRMGLVSWAPLVLPP